jgi:hypothetical protein
MVRAGGTAADSEGSSVVVGARIAGFVGLAGDVSSLSRPVCGRAASALAQSTHANDAQTATSDDRKLQPCNARPPPATPQKPIGSRNRRAQ